MQTRHDIQSLRALAVMMVLGYHFGVWGMQGGFAGVDVFFVISGYLMSRILIDRPPYTRSACMQFYAARVRRIVPALLAMIAALLCIGMLVLPPRDYAELGWQALAAIGFVANQYYYAHAGYFAPLAHEQWLLHTWSLAVEWQFYLLYPLLVAALMRLCHASPQRALAWVLVVSLPLSLGLCIGLSSTHSHAVFYWLPMRWWELAAGAVVAIAPAGNWQERISLHGRMLLRGIGWLLLFACAAMLQPHAQWPGLPTLWPVAATMLLLWLPPAARVKEAGCWRRYADAGCLWLGDRSYALYLWHWPAAVTLVLLQWRDVPEAVAVAMAVSIALAAISYRYIEQPLRRQKLCWRWLATPVLLVMLALAVAMSDGVVMRASRDMMAREERALKAHTLPAGCVQPSLPGMDVACQPASPRFVLLGDSHATPIYGALATAMGGEGWLLSASCPPMRDAYVDFKGNGNRCSEPMRALEQALQLLPADVPLVVAYRFSAYLKGQNESPLKPLKLQYLRLSDKERAMDATARYQQRSMAWLCALRARGNPVFVVDPIAEMGRDVPRSIARAQWWRGLVSAEAGFYPSVSVQEYYARHAPVLLMLDNAAQRCGITRIHTARALCSGGACASHGADGEIWYRDDDHLSPAGAAQLLPLFRAIKR